MRILLYVEPHPIRNSLTHFGDIAKFYCSILGRHHAQDLRLFANTATLNLLSPIIGEERAQFLIYPTKGEEKLFETFNKQWDGERHRKLDQSPSWRARG